MNYVERLKTVIGENNLSKLNDSKVLIIGLGGVGGSCFETLVRNYIGTIYICDFDIFEESNLNRQTLSNINNIGKYKTDEAYNYAKTINPDVNIIKINEKLTKDNINDLLPKNIDYVIDACDDTLVKIELIKFAINNKIEIISSMGTGNKTKPELLEITNIWKTSYDPLAKKIRALLKKEHINYKLPVVSSKEEIKIEGNILGSCSVVPNTAGILLASYIINKIID